MKDAQDYLLDILEEIEKIASFTQDGIHVFYADEKAQYAVMMAYTRIGEIVKRLPQPLLDTEPQMDWRSIKGFRDILIHRYDDVQPRRVWEAVEKLPILKNAITTLLTGLDEA